MIEQELARALESIASVPILLVASDYDGTIAPIVAHPPDAKPHREAIVALRTLSGLPQTYTALISGRSLRDLAGLSQAPEDVHLVGSHGSEFDPDFARSLSDAQSRLRAEVQVALAAIAERTPGLTLEEKPASVALHYRNGPPDCAADVERAVLEGPAKLEGVFVKRGKMVIELSVVTLDKGAALQRIRHRVGATAVLFLGDDVTDEDVFATLKGPDLSIKVGPGETRATYRVGGPDDVARVLAHLSELRHDWLAGAEAVPIEQHSMLSDQRTAALVTPSARVVWLCLPRLDSPSLFAELLGGPSAGHFSIRPASGEAPVAQRYLDGSLVLTTRWPRMSVTDFLDVSGGRPQQRAGRSDLVRVVEGAGKALLEFCPRLEFGRVPTRLTVRDGGLEIDDSIDPIVLRSPGVTWSITQEGPHHSARAEVDLTGSPLVLELRYGTGSLRGGVADALDRKRLTERMWGAWADQLELPRVEPDLVRHSALVLKGLCYGPTGAFAAAATTSLPEHVGGVRNWDYRFCWLRDAAMTASALVKLGTCREAMQYLDWVLGVVDECHSPERLHPLYTLTGAELGAEGEIAELAGYRGSRPVRVGNLAANQVQLDVFGPVVELVWHLAERDAPLSSQHFRLVEQMLLAIERRWAEPDHGIWEIRGPRRHHVHSKVMCWLAVDRAISVAERFLDRAREEWKSLRAAIAKDVLENGYHAGRGAFTAAYGVEDLDAASLFVGLSGLLPVADPRFVSTVAAIEEELLEGPTVYRYRGEDGLPGFEGGFHICASWLVDAYLKMGRTSDAWSLFSRMVALAGPTGILSEQYGAKTRRALGNVPQAYSHIGVIENALALSREP